MTRDDIIRMAREAGISIANSILLPAPEGQVEALERFAALVAEHKQKELDRIFNVLCQISMLTDLGGEVAEYQDVVEAVKRIAVAEREACAKVCDFQIARLSAIDEPRPALAVGICASAIRARGQA